MIDRMADSAAMKLVENEIIGKKDYEVYMYGFQLMFSTFIKSAGILAIALILGFVKETIIFAMAFGILRVHSGGYHAGGYLRCFITSALTFFVSIAIGKLFIDYFTLTVVIVLLLLSIASIFKYAPIESINKPLSESQRTKFKIKSRVIVIFESFLALSIWIFNDSFKEYGVLIVLALVLVSITSIPVKTLTHKKIERRLSK